jgi:hypothetical protein
VNGIPPDDPITATVPLTLARQTLLAGRKDALRALSLRRECYKFERGGTFLSLSSSISMAHAQ